LDLTAISHASVFVKFGMLVSAAPLVAGVLYAVRPNEKGLALMRPLSLAAIFASVSSLLLGVANALVYIGKTAQSGSSGTPHAATILSEAVIPSFVGFACLTVAWLSVAIAVRRSA
jgi:hypothetical protein